ncbi:MAG: 3-phosphoserine/phosphohydroxythreonine transaminase, partial [Apilactobacillus kunkeei]|nr:3-phosphoserine/phosphohydroxythreonine transaminase [Apilactobacillus kunkeei]
KKDERSYTNIVFTTNDDDLDAQFVDFAADNDLVSLKGHRSIGGLRASLYNAMSLEGVEKLIDVLTKFEQNRG